MNDVAFVGAGQGRRNLSGDDDDLFGGKNSPFLNVSFERSAANKFHDDADLSVIVDQIQHFDDVGVRELTICFGFLHEPVDNRFVAVIVKPLDRNGFSRDDIFCTIHGSVRTMANALHNSILPLKFPAYKAVGRKH